MTFTEVLKQHQERYPLMEPQDFGKLAYQSEFGPEHMVASGDCQLLLRLMTEWGTVPEHSQRPPELIGNGLCRFHLSGGYDLEQAVPLLYEVFSLTAQEHSGTIEGLQERLALLQKLPIPGMQQWLKHYLLAGCPAVHHSSAYKAAYQPHYRVIQRDYANYFPALLMAWQLSHQGQNSILAIDGRCGSGKTSLATLMQNIIPCQIVHMDDFYLPVKEREPGWETIPGGNMNLSGFLRDVMLPLTQHQPAVYRPYRCQTGQYLPACSISPSVLTIVEGSYAMHPLLSSYYTQSIFLTCSPEMQKKRLLAREGEYYQVFANRWIPLEETYIRQFSVVDRCNLLLDSSGFI